jgi:hypothetical protein
VDEIKDIRPVATIVDGEIVFGSILPLATTQPPP